MIIKFKNKQHYIYKPQNISWENVVNHYRKSKYFLDIYHNTIDGAQKNISDKVYHIWLLRIDIFELIKDDINFNKKRLK